LPPPFFWLQKTLGASSRDCVVNQLATIKPAVVARANKVGVSVHSLDEITVIRNEGRKSIEPTFLKGFHRAAWVSKPNHNDLFGLLCQGHGLAHSFVPFVKRKALSLYFEEQSVWLANKPRHEEVRRVSCWRSLPPGNVSIELVPAGLVLPRKTDHVEEHCPTGFKARPKEHALVLSLDGLNSHFAFLCHNPFSLAAILAPPQLAEGLQKRGAGIEPAGPTWTTLHRSRTARRRL
jgi:hypothetical protein